MRHEEVAPETELHTQCSHVRGCRILVYGYSDGATSGVWQRQGCGGEFLFDLVDVDEREDSTDVRVFSLRPVPTGSFDRALEVMPGDEPPTWPHWWPGWDFPSKEEELKAREVVDSVERLAGPATCVLACEIHPFRVIAGRPVSEIWRPFNGPRRMPGASHPANAIGWPGWVFGGNANVTSAVMTRGRNSGLLWREHAEL